MIDPSELPLGWGLLEADSDGNTSEKTLPTRFNQTAIFDWLVQIGKASTTREIRAVLIGVGRAIAPPPSEPDRRYSRIRLSG